MYHNHQSIGIILGERCNTVSGDFHVIIVVTRNTERAQQLEEALNTKTPQIDVPITTVQSEWLRMVNNR